MAVRLAAPCEDMIVLRLLQGGVPKPVTKADGVALATRTGSRARLSRRA